MTDCKLLTYMKLDCDAYKLYKGLTAVKDVGRERYNIAQHNIKQLMLMLCFRVTTTIACMRW